MGHAETDFRAPDPEAARGRRGLKAFRLSRRIGRAVIAVALGVFLAALALEVGLRVSGWRPYFDPIGPRGLFLPDDELGIRLNPGFHGRHVHPDFAVDIAINADGMRDRELAPKPEGTFRILSLGDSFAYGQGVEVDETYGHRLETLLSNSGRSIEVWSASAPSYGQSQMRVLFARLAKRVEPDLLLATFFFVNDPEDNVGSKLTARGGLVVRKGTAAYIDATPLLSFAFDHSELLLWASLAWYKRRYGVDLAPPLASAAGPYEAWPDGIGDLSPTPSPELEERWRVTEHEIAGLAAEVRGAGCELVLIDLPLWYQLDPNAWSALVTRYGIAPETVDLRFAADRLATVCAREGIHFFDTMAALSAPGASAFYHPQDRHLNARGHAALAEALGAFLTERGLVPGP